MSTVATPAAPVTGAQQNAAQTNGPGAANGQAQAPVEVRKMKLKVDGQDVELPESEVIAGFQLSKTSTQRFQEAAKLKQEADRIMQFANENPEEIFKKTGMSAREWAEKYLLQQLQNDAMSPEQKKARENEDKLRKLEKEDVDRKEKVKQEHVKRLEQEHMQRYDVMFTKALNESGLPKTKFTVKRMAELQSINLKKGLELDASQLAKVVREDFLNEKKSLLEGMNGNQLLEFLGPELIKKFSKAQIAKLKSRGVGERSGAQQGQSRANTQANVPQTFKSKKWS